MRIEQSMERFSAFGQLRQIAFEALCVCIKK